MCFFSPIIIYSFQGGKFQYAELLIALLLANFFAYQGALLTKSNRRPICHHVGIHHKLVKIIHFSEIDGLWLLFTQKQSRQSCQGKRDESWKYKSKLTSLH